MENVVGFFLRDCVMAEAVIGDSGKCDGDPLSRASSPFPDLSRALKEIMPFRFPTGPYVTSQRTKRRRQSSVQTSDDITCLAAAVAGAFCPPTACSTLSLSLPCFRSFPLPFCFPW